MQTYGKVVIIQMYWRAIFMSNINKPNLPLFVIVSIHIIFCTNNLNYMRSFIESRPQVIKGIY